MSVIVRGTACPARFLGLASGNNPSEGLDGKNSPRHSRLTATSLPDIIPARSPGHGASPFYLLFNSLLPLATFVLFCAVFYQEIPHDLPVIVCDQDDSTLSRKFTRMADATSSLQVIATVQDPAEGAAMIRLGKAYAVFLVPAGLEQDLKRGETPAIVTYYNNAYLLASGLVSRAAREVIGTLSAGLDLRSRMMKGESPAQALESYEPVKIDAHVLFNPNLNYRYLLLPSVLPSVLQAFILMVVVRSLGGELKHGTAGAWMHQSGGTRAAVMGNWRPIPSASS